MEKSLRVSQIEESVTLKLNEKATQLAEQGKKVFNLTAGQLPFKPEQQLIEKIQSQTHFLKSYQYAPVSGIADLRKKFLNFFNTRRGFNLPENFDCIVSNGAKQCIYNALGALVNPDDEVILLAPYWVSYPPMISFWGGEVKAVESSIYNCFTPEVLDIEKAITAKTKVIIINSPNNPSGIHYDENWMREFGEMLKRHEHVNIISDEIYYELNYFDPKPKYYYQFFPELIDRTIVIDGVSKSFASTGLRIGYAIGPKEIIKEISKIQAQTTSGANSLMQKAFLEYSFETVDDYLSPIKEHLRSNARYVQEKYRAAGFSNSWYQSNSAFYFLVYFSNTPLIEKYRDNENDETDYADKICSDILGDIGVAMVPSSDFGLKNAARISLVSEKMIFQEAIDLLVDYLGQK